VLARYEALAGAPWPVEGPPASTRVWSDLHSYVLGLGASMDSMLQAARHCDPDVLLQLEAELAEAGLADEPASVLSAPAEDPGRLTFGDRLEVEWSVAQIWRPGGDVAGAQAKMVALLERRGGSKDAVGQASRVQRGLETLRGMWDVCSGRHCSEILPVLGAVHEADAETLRLSEPRCQEIVGSVGPTGRAALQRLMDRREASNASLEGELGQLAFGLYSLGCVHGVPGRFEGLDPLRARVQSLPASCGSPPPPAAGLVELLAFERKAILGGCTPRPWGSPP
jgi:hypothetical protein